GLRGQAHRIGDEFAVLQRDLAPFFGEDGVVELAECLEDVRGGLLVGPVVLAVGVAVEEVGHRRASCHRCHSARHATAPPQDPSSVPSHGICLALYVGAIRWLSAASPQQSVFWPMTPPAPRLGAASDVGTASAMASNMARVPCWAARLTGSGSLENFTPTVCVARSM